MKKTLMFLAALTVVWSAAAQLPSTGGFAACAEQWIQKHGDKYQRYKPEQFRQIADNIVAYQNGDGGWPKDIDVMAMLPPDSIRECLTDEHLVSTFGNMNICPQIEYLSTVFYLTDDSTYCHSARRGMEYILAKQRPDGGWTENERDAVSFSDGVTTGVLAMWTGVLQGDPIYAWADDGLKVRVRESFDRELALVLRCQQVRDGVKTGWPARCESRPAGPMKPIAYVPAPVAAAATANIVLVLMKIYNPSPEVSDAVRSAMTWLGTLTSEAYGRRGLDALIEYPRWMDRTAREKREADREARKAARKEARKAQK